MLELNVRFGRYHFIGSFSFSSPDPVFQTPAKVADDFRDLRKLDTMGAAGDAGRRTMTADTPEPPPRRKWHLQRWLVALVAAMLAYVAWKEYAFRSALKRANALGWEVTYIDPVEMIRADWKRAFKKETWLDGVTVVDIWNGEELAQHSAIVRRLNSTQLEFNYVSTLPDLSALEGLTRLEKLTFRRCTILTNVDALKNLPALKEILLIHCTALTNLDGLKNLRALQAVGLEGCRGLTNVDWLKSLPALRGVGLSGCTGITNVDALKGLTALESVNLNECTGLTNVDALKSLPAIENIWLFGCTGLTKEHITALQAALPDTQIFSDYQPHAPMPLER